MLDLLTQLLKDSIICHIMYENITLILKESGAYRRPSQTGGMIANVVLFEDGKVIDTVALYVGGRLLEIHKNGSFSDFPSSKILVDTKGI